VIAPFLAVNEPKALDARADFVERIADVFQQRKRVWVFASMSADQMACPGG